MSLIAVKQRMSGFRRHGRRDTTMNMTEGRPLALLSVFALPLLIVCLLFAGGVVLLCPLLVVFAAFWILKKIIA